jgi:hypothetical protein
MTTFCTKQMSAGLRHIPQGNAATVPNTRWRHQGQCMQARFCTYAVHPLLLPPNYILSMYSCHVPFCFNIGSQHPAAHAVSGGSPSMHHDMLLSCKTLRNDDAQVSPIQ